MTAVLGFLGAWAVRSLLLILLAGVACNSVRRLSADARHIVWRCALAGSVLIGLGMLVIPAVGLSARIPTSVVSATLAPRAPSVYVRESPGRAVEDSDVRPTRSHHVEAVPADSLLIWKLAAWAYVLGVLVSFSRWVLSLGRTLRLCRAARPADGFDDVLIAERPDLMVPFTLGWRKPVIVLPANSLAWSDRRRDAVILHERSHMKRQDWIWQSAATIVAALQWFNPAVWLLAAKLRETAEEAADNEVLATGFAPSAYAGELMAFATATSAPVGAAIAIAGRGNIAARLRSILAANLVRKPAKRSFVLATAGSFGLVALALAACVATPVKASAGVWALFQSRGEAKFSDGVRVAVIYVGPAESSSLPVWRYDGTPAGGTGESLSHAGRYSSSGSQPGKQGVAVAFDLIGMPPNDADADSFRAFVVRLGGVTDNGGGSGGAKNVVHANRSFHAPASWSLADFEIGRGSGKYWTVADNREGVGSLAVEVTRKGETVENRTVNGRTTIESRHAASEIKFTLPDAVKDKDWRLRALDADGNSLKLHVSYRSEWTSPDHRTVTVHCNAAPETIEQIVLEARDYEWVTIKNLHLLRNSAIHP